MPLDPQRLMSMPPIIKSQELTRRDTILYALGIGATELDFVFEERLKALPTLPVVLGAPGFFWRQPEYGVNWQRILHGEQSLEIHAPLPIEGRITGETRIEAVVDKGADKGAIVHTSRRILDDRGVHFATVRGASFLRGDGGFGGSAEGGRQPNPPPPDRPCDLSVDSEIWPHQALLYRLSGDLNPLHIDPDVARIGGFSAPILHGLCTYGIAGRALLHALCDNDPSRVRRFDVRFASPVYPGETITTEIWKIGEGRASVRTSIMKRKQIVATNGIFDYLPPA